MRGYILVCWKCNWIICFSNKKDANVAALDHKATQKHSSVKYIEIIAIKDITISSKKSD